MLFIALLMLNVFSIIMSASGENYQSISSIIFNSILKVMWCFFGIDNINGDTEFIIYTIATTAIWTVIVIIIVFLVKKVYYKLIKNYPIPKN